MRTLTSAQAAALAATDRTTYLRVKIEDPDGAMQDITDFLGYDWLHQVAIDANTDTPISSATVVLHRKIGSYSMAPLDEASLVNRDSGGSYAPFLNPNRAIEIWTDVVPAGYSESSVVQIWDGEIDEVDWGGRGSQVVLRCRDGMGRLNDTFIETEATYGSDAGSKDVEDVMQDILTAEISSPAITLNYTATNFNVLSYPLANVSVLDALIALRDLIGWNLTWKWTGSDFGLVLWEPNRTNTTAAFTFGPDDYFVLPKVAVNQEGIRNKGEVVYLTTAGTVASATDTRTSSVTLYSTRFIRIDARGTSVVTATQASDLLSNVLDDLEEPSVLQEVELPFFWPVELGDLYEFSPNDHYSTAQKWAVFGFRHILSANGPRRTILSVSGKPSGGYDRWHRVERDTLEGTADVFGLSVAINDSGEVVVSAQATEDTANIYVTVGNGSAPSDPTSVTNDGTISGTTGSVNTGVTPTVGNTVYVKAVGYNAGAVPGPVKSAQSVHNNVVPSASLTATNPTFTGNVFIRAGGANTVALLTNGGSGGQLILSTTAGSQKGDFSINASGYARLFGLDRLLLQSDSGIYIDAASSTGVYLQENATTQLRVVGPTTNDYTSIATIMVRISGSNSTRTVEIGATDSGGSGYRMLRVTN